MDRYFALTRGVVVDEEFDAFDQCFDAVSERCPLSYVVDTVGIRIEADDMHRFLPDFGCQSHHLVMAKRIVPFGVIDIGVLAFIAFHDENGVRQLKVKVGYDHSFRGLEAFVEPKLHVPRVKVLM